MWANGIRVHSEKRHGNKCAIAPESQHSVTQFERSMVLVGVPLVEVDVFEDTRLGFLDATHRRRLRTHGNAILCGISEVSIKWVSKSLGNGIDYSLSSRRT